MKQAVPVSLPDSRSHRKVHIVLPAYNEEPNLPTLLESLRATMEDNLIQYEVIVVDDGSADRTAEIVKGYAREMPAVLVQHVVNQGLGATLRDGLYAALERSADRDLIVTMDADDTHTPGLITRMIRMIGEGYDVVIASRYRAESRVYGVPILRRVMSRAASLLMRVLFPIRGVRDYTCGYRAYRASVLRKAIAHYGSDFLNQEGFQCMVDILLKLRPMQLIIGEAPMLLRYDRKGGQSKMKVWRTARQTLLLLARRRLGY
jgi:dolichol-phosphate mannosyltransferase